MGYLESYYERTQPLSSLEKLYAKLAGFDERFEAGEVPGWADRGEGPSTNESSAIIDLAAFASVEEVETLGEGKTRSSLHIAALALNITANLAEGGVAAVGPLARVMRASSSKLIVLLCIASQASTSSCSVMVHHHCAHVARRALPAQIMQVASSNGRQTPSYFMAFLEPLV